MSFKIYIKKEIQNEISLYIDQISKVITVNSLNIQNGLLIKGSYQIPINDILFIEEI